MNWLLIAVICIIAWNVVRGYTRGVLRMVYSLAAWIVMLAASTMAAPYVRDQILSQTGIEPVILNGIEKQIAAQGQKATGDFDMANILLQQSGAYDTISVQLTNAIVSDSRMIAVSDQNIMVFDGSQKPKLKQTIKLEKLIDSVFYNNKYIGVAYSNNDKNCTSHIKLYDFNGKMLMENDTAIAYNSIEFDSNNEVCVTGDTACEIYTIHGVKKFYHTFDNKLYKVMYKSGMNNYIFIYDGAMDEVRLK